MQLSYSDYFVVFVIYLLIISFTVPKDRFFLATFFVNAYFTTTYTVKMNIKDFTYNK